MSFGTWLLGIGVAGALFVSLLLHPLTHRFASDARAALGARLAASARISLVIAAAVAALVRAMQLGTGLSSAVQGLAWVTAGILVLPWLANAVAGLWFLSRVSDAGIGDTIVACGQTGRIRDFGVTRLELVSDAERRVYLPYFSLVRQPLVVERRNRSSLSSITLERESWSEADLGFVRQAAILAPYRDVTVPVSVEARGTIATVNMALVRPELEASMKRLLSDALVRR